MIHAKQMTELNRLKTNLEGIGVCKKPSLEHHVMMALVSGEVPKIKSAADISKTARTRIVNERYSRSLNFGDVFLSCNGYEGEMKSWNVYEKVRSRAVDKFKKESDKVMLKALEPDANGEMISSQLHEAADKSGLRDLIAPKFDCAE